MNDFDTAVRETLRELAGEVRPASLARPALRRAKWFRARRAALSTVTAVVAVAAVGAPYAILRDDRAGEPVAPPPASPVASPTQAAAPSLADGPVRLPGGWVLAGGVSAGKIVIWDRVRGQYREVPYSAAYAAPVGDFVAVSKADEEQLGILNLRNGNVHWLDLRTPCGTVDWSSDGKRFVYSGSVPGGNGTAVMVVDAASGAARKIREVGLNCALGWLPGNQEIVVRTGGTPVQAYSAADGRPTRTLTVPDLLARINAWSPDSRRVVTGTETTSVIRDAGTGRALCTLHDDLNSMAYWAGNDQVLLVRQNEVVLYSAACQRLQSFPWPQEFQEGELHNFPLARG